MPVDVLSPEAIITGLVGFIGTLFGVIAFFYRQHVAGDAKLEEQRDKRESQLIAERDAWQHRWEATDGRLERVTNAFVQAFNRPAPE